MENKKAYIIVGIVSICCIIMGYIDAVIKPEYVEKSIIKIVLFSVCPMIYSLYDKQIQIKDLFKFRKKGISISIFLGIGTFLIILGGYFIISPFIDLSKITVSLTTNIGVSRENFIFVSTYIALVNSLLEEFFFRGFAFLTLLKLTSKNFAYIFSSLSFALYHVAMMIGWFSIWLYILAVAGLMVGGIIFNYLNEKSENIYTSWMMHMFANFAINSVGFILFGLIG